MLTPTQIDRMYQAGSVDYLHKSLLPTGPFILDDESDEHDLDTPDFTMDYDDESVTFTRSDLSYLRDFILNTALYVEDLENSICERSQDFWESREHAYRIITGLLIDLYQHEME